MATPRSLARHDRRQLAYAGMVTVRADPQLGAGDAALCRAPENDVTLGGVSWRLASLRHKEKAWARFETPGRRLEFDEPLRPTPRRHALFAPEDEVAATLSDLSGDALRTMTQHTVCREEALAPVFSAFRRDREQAAPGRRLDPVAQLRHQHQVVRTEGTRSLLTLQEEDLFDGVDRDGAETGWRRTYLGRLDEETLTLRYLRLYTKLCPGCGVATQRDAASGCCPEVRCPLCSTRFRCEVVDY